MSREEIEREQMGLGRIGDLTEPIKRERGENIPPVAGGFERRAPADLRRPDPLTLQARAEALRQPLRDIIPQTYPTYDTLPANGLVLNTGDDGDFSYNFGDSPPAKELMLSYTVPSGRVLRLTGFQVNVYKGLYDDGTLPEPSAGVPNELFFITMAVNGSVELTNQRIPVEPLDGYYDSFLMVNGNETLELFGNFSNYPAFDEPNVSVTYYYVARIRGHLLSPNNLPYQYTTLLGRNKNE